MLKKLLFSHHLLFLALSLSLTLSFLSTRSLSQLSQLFYFALSVSIFGHGPLGLAIEQTAEKQGWL